MFASIPRLLEAVSAPFKRAQLGLFHGKTKQYGNNVPFSKRKTRRSWLPNVQNKRLMSDSIGENITVKVTTRALRTIKKYGGLDNYVLKTKSELLGSEGMRIRVRVREHQEQEKRRVAEDLEKKRAHEAGEAKKRLRQVLAQRRAALRESRRVAKGPVTSAGEARQSSADAVAS